MASRSCSAINTGCIRAQRCAVSARRRLPTPERRGVERRRWTLERRLQGRCHMNISTGFIQRPIATSLLMAGIFLIGVVAFPLLPVAPLPQVDFPTIQVSATLPGASPETMASSVAQPLEYQFGQIPGVTQLT